MRTAPASFALLTVSHGAAACLMIAALSLLAVEAIGPVHAVVLAGSILYGRWRGTRAPARGVWDALALLALLIFPLDLFILSRSLIGAALRLLTFVVIFRCANLSGHREVRQAIALSFVQMVAAAASTTEVWFALPLAAYLAVAIWTLMAIASARDHAPSAVRVPPAGRPALAMTASTLAVGSILFFAIPHLGTGYFHPSSLARRPGEALTGFADRIELGSISRIKKSREIVMRARVSPADGSAAAFAEPALMPARWRGVALDTFDGRSWSVARPDREWIPPGADGSFAVGPPPDPGRPLVRQEITLNPGISPVLFALPGATRIVSDEVWSLGVDAGGAIFLAGPRMRHLRYTALSPDPVEEMGGVGADRREGKLVERDRYLTLPRLDPRVAELSLRVAPPGESDFGRARRLEDYLRGSHAYTLEVNDAGVSDPVAHFLLEGHPGHCEYFATSMAVMLRHLGIPSRVVNGFASGEWSDLTESFVVRQSDAHSWVEAWVAGRGWVTFDPTPSSLDIAAEKAGLVARLGRAMDRVELMWDTWVIGLDLLDQRSIVSSIYDGAARWGAVAKATFAALLRRAAGRGAAPLAAGVALGVMLLAWLAARRLDWPGWPAWAGGGRARPGTRSPASETLRRFEARWASRGVRRRPGQTPLEFAREIERLALDPPGSALAFVETYYRARFGC